MRIEKSCGGAVAAPPEVEFSSIPNGTVFRYSNHKFGPYLKVFTGIVDMHGDLFYPHTAASRFPNYEVLPNARLVLE